MSKPKRHLHSDYNHAFCGKDASHILMTYEPKEVTCATCIDAHQKAEAKSGKA